MKILTVGGFEQIPRLMIEVFKRDYRGSQSRRWSRKQFYRDVEAEANAFWKNACVPLFLGLLKLVHSRCDAFCWRTI